MHANRGKRKDVRNLFEKMPQCVEVPWKSHRDVGFVCLKKGEVKRMNGHPLALTRACSISAASEQVYIVGMARFSLHRRQSGMSSSWTLK
ncbi:hypothetical protein SUGI_0220520 [Cryptomeria japonica]|nr:hypothetical protein SUGI_0220520 [Cryptomeria japonica]